MQLVIFDIDGTLTDTVGIDDECFVGALRKTFGIELENIDWSTYRNATDSGLLHEIFENEFSRPPAPEEIFSFKENFFSLLHEMRKNSPHVYKEIPGARNFFLRLLEDECTRVGIATGCFDGSARVKLSAVGIPTENLLVSCADEFQARADIVRRVICHEEEKISPEKFSSVTYIGDGVWDYKTSQILEINFIGIDSKGTGKLRSLGAEKVISDYRIFDDIAFNTFMLSGIMKNLSEKEASEKRMEFLRRKNNLS